MVKTTRDASTTQEMRAFARRLRLLRVAIEEMTGDNQGDICRRIGVEQSRWSKWEKGEHPMHILFAISFCRCYSIATGYLLEGERGHLRRDLANKIEEIEARDEADKTG